MSKEIELCPTCKEKKKKEIQEFASEHNLEITKPYGAGKLQEVLKKGICPCLPKWRKCPSKECLDDIKEAGVCYCLLFKTKGTEIDFKKHNLMTKKVRDKLGISKQKI